MELISRQALIKDAESWTSIDECERHLQKNVIEWLKEFPSAELGTDYISRQAAIDALRDWEMCYDWDEYCREEPKEPWVVSPSDVVNKLPPIQPEIVRCKDCKNWMPYDWMFSEVWRSKNMADYPEDEIGCACSDMAMKANDFCSRAERREVTT